MRKLILLFLCASAWATTPVTGHIQNLGTQSVSSGAFVRFWLRGCGGNQPRVAGVGVIAPSQGGVFYFDFPAGANGLVSGTLYSTRDATGNNGGEIECGGSTRTVWYGMQIYQSSKGGPEMAVHALNGVTLDITTVQKITSNPQ